MKKKSTKTVTTALLMIFAVAVSFFCPVMKADAAEEEYAIVVSANATSTEMYAAETLQEYLYEINKSLFEIITDDTPFDGFKFCVGATSVYDTADDLEGKAADSYVIAPFHDGIAIFGAGGRGTIYGVHTFLEKFCGYKCYGWYPAMVMTSDKMTLPQEKIEYEPFFEYRNTDWRSGWMSLYSVSHKLNGVYQTYSPEQGGNIPYLGDAACHTLSTVFCSAEKYFESHPEYFALRDGERFPTQLCLTNDEVYEIVLNEVLEVLNKEHDSKADLQIISLSQADNLDYCECENCKALDNANGSHAGSLITFVNRVADAVKAAGYSNIAFDTLAYTYSRKAPSQVRPKDNVIVTLCTFECCFSHTLDDSSCQVNRELIEDLEDWSGICNRLYIWDYTTNYAYTLGIFPDFNVLQKNIQCFNRYGVKGVYEEGNYYVDRCDTEFGELRTYLIAELLENPYCNYDAKMLEFCNGYYGEGGEYIKEIIDELTACTKGHVNLICRMGDTFSIDDEEAEKIDGLWALAESASEGSDDALEAIGRSKLSWRYVKAVLGLREFGGTLEENRDTRESLFNDLISHGVRMIDEWTWIEDDFAEYELIPVEEWEYADRFFYLVYNLNGGTDGPANQWSFMDVIPDVIPKRNGFRFLGWAMEAGATAAQYQPGDSIDLKSDLTLYAVWEESDGHDYQFSRFVWADDFTAKAMYVCSFDSSHIVYYDADVISVTDKEATCSENGKKTYTASYDGHSEAKTVTTAKNADNHIKAVSIPAVAPTCSESGLTEGSKCSGCGKVLTAQQTIPATGKHVDSNNDGRCDECNAQLGSPSQNTNICKWCGKDHSVSFWQKIIGFFHRIFALIFGSKY